VDAASCSRSPDESASAFDGIPISFHREARVLKSTCAVVVGVVAWFLTAFVGNLLLRAVLPGYTEVEVDMNFTLAMKLCRLTLALVASLCAGFVCAAIAGLNSHAAKVLGCGLLLLFLPIHYSLWDKFPVWYHLFFLVTLAPAVMLGSALYSKLASARPPAAAQPDAT
jgi:hypothetical protein